MASIVFLRGANVGGHRTFKPALLARQLADFGVTSIGAAGTFLVRSEISEKSILERFRKTLPFTTDIMVSSERELLRLTAHELFRRQEKEGEKLFVSILGGTIPRAFRFPRFAPGKDDWQVKLAGASGPFVLSIHRRTGRGLLYPNEVVEKLTGLPATTRTAGTIRKIVTLSDSPATAR